MAQTKRKRRTKHRGNAAGVVEVRGKTHKGGVAGPAKGSARDAARQRRQNRFDQPPTWRSAALRAGVAALIFVVLVVLAFKRPIAEGVALGAFVLLFYIPLGYFTDLALYKRRQIQKRKQADEQ